VDDFTICSHIDVKLHKQVVELTLQQAGSGRSFDNACNGTGARTFAVVGAPQPPFHATLRSQYRLWRKKNRSNAS
jgi:hypothetical protein